MSVIVFQRDSVMSLTLKFEVLINFGSRVMQLILSLTENFFRPVIVFPRFLLVFSVLLIVTCCGKRDQPLLNVVSKPLKMLCNIFTSAKLTAVERMSLKERKKEEKMRLTSFS